MPDSLTAQVPGAPRPPAAPVRLRLWSLVIGVLRRPIETFEDVAEGRPWRRALLLASGITLVSDLVALAAPPPSATLIQAAPGLAALLQLRHRPGFMLGEALLLTPLALLIIAGLAYFWARLLGGHGAFTGLLAALAFTGVPVLFIQPWILLVNFLQRTGPDVTLACATALVGFVVCLWSVGLDIVALGQTMRLTAGQAVGAFLLLLGSLTPFGCVAGGIAFAVIASHTPHVAGGQPPATLLASPTPVAASSPTRTPFPTPTQVVIPTPTVPPPYIGDQTPAAGQVVTAHVSSTGAVRFLAWSPDGRYLATATIIGTGQARLWRIEGGTFAVAQDFALFQPAPPAAWSPDGTLLVISGQHVMNVYGVNGVVQRFLNGGTPTAVAWSPDGSVLAVGAPREIPGYSSNFYLQFMRLDGSTSGVQIPAALTALAWTQDGHTLLSVDTNGTIQRWGADGHLLDTRERMVSESRISAWSPGATLLASVVTTNIVQLWNADGRPLVQLLGHTGPVTSIAWSPDGTQLATSSADGTVRVWRSDGTLRTVLSGFAGGALCVAWSPDGQTVATGDNYGIVRLWHLK